VKTIPNNNDAFTLNLRHQSGYSLIEILIAAFLLSFSILGIAGLQVIGMKGTHQSLMKQQAVGIVQNITERMRANSASLSSYEFDSNNINCSSAPVDCTANECTLAQIATFDINNIVCGYGNNPSTAAIKPTSGPGVLLDGALKVKCVNVKCAKGDVKITVSWKERALGKDETAQADSLVLTTRVSQ